MRAADGCAARRRGQNLPHASELSEEDLSQAQNRVARQIHENGVTYNVYATTEGRSVPGASTSSR